MPSLKEEIAQQRPFSSKAEEAMLNLLRTADCLSREMQREVRQWNITSTQYNVLRILRGAHPEGLPCAAIGDRMITADPDITRLLSRLKARKLVRQERHKKDRRVLWTYISDAGLSLLAEMDPIVSRFPTQLLGHLGEQDLGTLTRLLEEARSRCGEVRVPSCDGKADSVTCNGSQPG